MSKVIMVQGTMSNAGKSLIVAGLCRIMKQDGYRVAPFKSQNMALNSYITNEGLEMGRAQVMQAEAAGIEPMVCMNPILLKPTTNTGSQVIVNGEVIGNMSARDYFKYKRQLIPDIKKAFKKLEEFADIIVIEGAGSPAEINLRENDIVNMGLAQMIDAPVLLVGDIDRGGVFAQLLGTLMLLTKEEKERVKGLIINKFRGDKTLLDSGIEMLEEKGNVPVVGVVPYMDISLEDEDSLTNRFDKKGEGLIDIAVIRFPRISNFTDFNVFEQMEDVSVRYVDSVSGLHHADMIILPGSKNTMGDLKWMRQTGLESAIKKMSEEIPVFGICGGYQMLGETINDFENVEEGGSINGMGLLSIRTELKKEKVRSQVEGKINNLDGIFSSLSGLEYVGYEIHMGRTDCAENESVIVSESNANVYGTYVHGIFDKGDIAFNIIQALANKKGVSLEGEAIEDYQSFKEKQFDKLADTLREYLNMDEIYGMVSDAHMTNSIEIISPDKIEKKSFEIISKELINRGIYLPIEEEMITKRVIHTSADFEYADTMTYSKGAVEIAKKLLRDGADIVTDTNMALSGINKKALASLGGSVHCYMADEDVASIAKQRGVTRAVVSMEKACEIEKPVIFAIGNAPTALIRLYEMIQEGKFRPAFIIGVPVGFVNVEAAKELIMETDVPYIINRGRKGGSNVAAAICNALIYELTRYSI